MFRSHVMVCGGTGCTSSGSDKIAKAFEDEILATGLENEVKVIRTGCFGLCALGPIVVIYPEGSFYSMVKEEDVKEIVDEHLLKGRPVTRLLYDETVAEDNTVKSLDDTAFYKKQMRIALRNCGVINPENIDEYIAFDGYQALGKVLTEMTPDDVCSFCFFQIFRPAVSGRSLGAAGPCTGIIIPYPALFCKFPLFSPRILCYTVGSIGFAVPGKPKKRRKAHEETHLPAGRGGAACMLRSARICRSFRRFPRGLYHYRIQRGRHPARKQHRYPDRAHHR